MQLIRRANDVERIVRRHVPDDAIPSGDMRKLIRELEQQGGDGGGGGFPSRRRAGVGFVGQRRGRRRTLTGAVFAGLGRFLAAVVLSLLLPFAALTGTSRGRRTVATRRWLVDRMLGAPRRG